MPLVGTWIEIGSDTPAGIQSGVVPLVGTWIEIAARQAPRITGSSCPSWARGLKSVTPLNIGCLLVVPLVGTWIEIGNDTVTGWDTRRDTRRAPRGHVD